MFDHPPELVLAEVRLHIVDDAGLDDRLAVIARIYEVLQGRIHRVRSLNIRAQENVAEVASNVPALQAPENCILFPLASAVLSCATPLFPRGGYFWTSHSLDSLAECRVVFGPSLSCSIVRYAETTQQDAHFQG